jgi:uncharacterized membrane protein YqiK
MLLTVLAGFGGLLFLAWFFGLRYIPHNRVGIIEKLWSTNGSLKSGQIIAVGGRAGIQAEILRGGLQFGLFPWQYRVHTEPLVVIGESKIGYVYARDGAPLAPTQTLASRVNCNSFQDSVAFLGAGGQRGRQRAILREGVYAINTALFVVITDNRVYAGPVKDVEDKRYNAWQAELQAGNGFSPVVIGNKGRSRNADEDDTTGMMYVDSIGVVTVHDGASIQSGDIIAPEVKSNAGEKDHNYFQDPEAFLALGGKRGKQLQVLTDGTYFINRWFATVEIHPKTLVPIGYVGVVVSYYGAAGQDVTGVGFRYGEQVEPGQRGVWKRALPPGKYALNPYALKLELVPTVNFVLRWITGQVEAHHYDEDLNSIELITADGYEPILPLSLVLHIDYEKAPSVIQRFGDVKRLINQTLDPILSSYFRDVAQSSHMLDLLTKRDEIQKRATEELAKRFALYDINCIAVLIGRPETKLKPGQKGEDDPIERLFDQLRMRRLAEEQIDTFAKQQEAAAKQRELNDARAAAEKQAELTQTKIGVEIAGNKAEAQLAEAHRLAKRDIARAEGEARTKVLLAESESRQKVLLAEGESRSKQLLAEGESRAKELIGKGEGARIAQTGLSEAAVFLQKIRAYGDPRLFALNMVGEQFSKSSQPLVPERLFVVGGSGGTGNGSNGNGSHGADTATSGMLGQLLSLLLAEKAGVNVGESSKGLEELETLARELTKKYAAGTAQDDGKALATDRVLQLPSTS